MAYITIPFTTDAETLADNAIDVLVLAWEGWEPNDGDLEVVMIESLAPMAQDVAEVASIVPDSIFRAYGTDLLGLPYQTGLAAVGTARISALDNAGYSAGVIEMNLSDVAFATDDALVIPPGQTSVDLPITAREIGVVGNGLTGFADSMVGGLPWLTTIEVIEPTAGGSDPEDDFAYQNRLADRLLLQATTLVTARDYELMAMAQEGIGRAMASFNQARQVDVAVADDSGEIVPQVLKDELELIYADYRQVNTQYNVLDATYTPIDVAFTLAILPGYTPQSVIDAAVAAVEEWLSPANWGRPRGVETTETLDQWLNEPIVRHSELERTLSVPGVRYVQAATLNGGTADVNLPGAAPLTRPDTIVGAAL